MNLREMALEIERLQREIHERTCRELLQMTGGPSLRCKLENDGHEWHESDSYLSTGYGSEQPEIRWRKKSS